MIIRREAINAVLPATTEDDTRYYLKSVAVETDGRLMATNGHILLIASDNAKQDDADFPTLPGAEYHGNPVGQTLIEASTLKRVVAAMPKRATMPILSSAQLSKNGSDQTATLASTDLQVPCIATITATGDRFPNVEQVLKSADAVDKRITLCLGVPVLEALIKSAKAIKGKGQQTITFEIPANGQTMKHGVVTDAVKVSMTGDDVTVHGLAMPCRA